MYGSVEKKLYIYIYIYTAIFTSIISLDDFDSKHYQFIFICVMFNVQNCIFICTKLFHAVNLLSTEWDFAKQTFFFKFEDVFFEDQRIKYKLNRILFPSCLAFFIFLFAFHSTSWIYNISWVISKHRCRWNFVVISHYDGNIILMTLYITTNDIWNEYFRERKNDF